MIRASAFHFRQYQTATYYANMQLAVGKVMPRLLGDLSDVLDRDPITVPVPDEAPIEIPVIILSNKDQSIRMQISRARADVYWHRKQANADMDLNEFCDFAQRAINSYQEATQVLPGRIALVVHRAQPDENPAKALAAHFCRPTLLLDEPGRKGPLNRPEKFELHAHKTFGLDRFAVNSWVRCKTGTIREGTEEHPAILVEQDLNTLAERLTDTEFSMMDIRDFHRLAIRELEVILRIYFPEAQELETKV